MNKRKMKNKLHSLWQHYANRSLSDLVEGNKIITDVVRLLLGGGTFLFILTGSFQQNIKNLDPCLKVSLVVSWVLIFVSFVFGFIQLVGDSSFLGSSSSRFADARDELAKGDEIEESKRLENANAILKNKPRVSRMWPFYWQVVLIGIAFILQMVVLSANMFS